MRPALRSQRLTAAVELPGLADSRRIIRRSRITGRKPKFQPKANYQAKPNKIHPLFPRIEKCQVDIAILLMYLYLLG